MSLDAQYPVPAPISMIGSSVRSTARECASGTTYEYRCASARRSSPASGESPSASSASVNASLTADDRRTDHDRSGDRVAARLPMPLGRQLLSAMDIER